MTVHNDTFTPAFGQSFSATISASVHNIVASLSAWNNARMTRNALTRLSDRELDDIGLSRGDVFDIR